MRRPSSWMIVAALLVGGCFGNVEPVDLTDPGITARVKTEFKNHPELDIQYLDVATHVGVVMLSGIVASEQTRYGLIRIARRVKGVKQVIANVLVRQ